MSDMVLTGTSTATAYHFRVESPHHGWAICTVNDVTGELTIQSDWGSWSHRWNVRALGDGETLTSFLSDRSSFEYLAGKLIPYDDQRCYSYEKTLENARDRLREARREFRRGESFDVDLDKDTCNELWDDTLPAICTDADVASLGEAVQIFVQNWLKVPALVAIVNEPWDMVMTEKTSAWRHLVDSILPALSAACAAACKPAATAAVEAPAAAQ